MYLLIVLLDILAFSGWLRIIFSSQTTLTFLHPLPLCPCVLPPPPNKKHKQLLFQGPFFATISHSLSVLKWRISLQAKDISVEYKMQNFTLIKWVESYCVGIWEIECALENSFLNSPDRGCILKNSGFSRVVVVSLSWSQITLQSCAGTGDDKHDASQSLPNSLWSPLGLFFCP